MSLLVLVLFVGFGAAHADNKEPGRKGTWEKKTYAVSGSWKIVNEDGRRYIQISDDFATKNGPDLKVFLSPKSLSDIRSSNATDGALKLGVLPKHKGKQRIAIPEAVDLPAYRSIAIHCEKYSVLFAASALN